jgi:hypothetical protein
MGWTVTRTAALGNHFGHRDAIILDGARMRSHRRRHPFLTDTLARRDRSAPSGCARLATTTPVITRLRFALSLQAKANRSVGCPCRQVGTSIGLDCDRSNANHCADRDTAGED